ncbi:MAG: hypothetical protein JRI58_01000 [Deltaproteobacteria bacterium]|nr:hypothetical protein [Deltaproteobacteria bacterium]MBW2073315.1 hypothetical protein [Deltaproteobacteria bacterium]RLB83175.1 MAG: hypothetical protein DRH17_02945 [Deltaproteobacteria bacterium]
MGDVFQFLSSASLEKLTGRKAYDLEDLLDLIKTCPDSSIFYHTFSAFLKMREVQVPYNTDFAIWVSRSLNEKALAEKLMAVDLSEYNTIKTLKMRFIEIIETYREQKPDAFQKTANEPFYLYDIIRVVYPTDKFAYDLKSFRELLPTISVYSMYFHFIESRLHTHLQTDDFSTWIEESLNIPDLAQMIRKIDFNVYTLEGLRTRIIQLIDEHLKEIEQKG